MTPSTTCPKFFEAVELLVETCSRVLYGDVLCQTDTTDGKMASFVDNEMTDCVRKREPMSRIAALCVSA